MVDQVFVEQDPEPDIADPPHTTNTHTPTNHRDEDRISTTQGNANLAYAKPDAYSQPTPGHGLSHSAQPYQGPIISESKSTSTVPLTLPLGPKSNQTRPTLYSPFASSTNESINEKDGAILHSTPVTSGGNNTYASSLADHERRHGRADADKQQGGAQGTTQITSAEGGDDFQHEDGDIDHDGDDQDAPLPKIGWKASAINTIKGCPILVALPVLIPVAWALEFSHQGDVAIFVTCLLAIIPLAGGIAFATEEIALRVGEVYGGLLNATFGNLVELLIAIIALVKGEIDIVQASMIGSILSNLLLVLGCSYFAGGLRFHEQMYGMPAAQMQIGLLGITLLAVALPSAYHWAYPNSVAIDSIPNGSQPAGDELNDLLQISRGISFILLACYAIYLTFQLYTHAYLFRVPRTKMVHPLPGPVPKHAQVFPKPNWVASLGDSSSTTSSSRSSKSGRFRRFRRWSVRSRGEETDHERHESIEQRLSPSVSIDPITRQTPATNDQHITIIEPEMPSHHGSIARRSPNMMAIDPPAPGAHSPAEAEARLALPPAALTSANVRQLEAASAAEEGRMNPQLVKDNSAHQLPVTSIWFAMLLLTIVTVLAGVTAEFLVSSIDGLTTQSGVSREFVGLILLPVIGNSVEHITAVTVSVKDKLNLSMSIAVGSSIQVSLCILPILVLIAWPLGQPLTLYFDPFETITLVVAVLLVNFAISDGRTNYLEGFVMMMAYICIALVCWFYNPIR